MAKPKVTAEEPPGGGGGETGVEFLGGFPSGFQVDVRDPGRPGDRTQATLDELRQLGRGGYVDTDVWLPINEEPGVVAQLQTLLVESGLLGEDDLTSPGYYDDSTREAYRALLVRANAWGTTWEGALTRLRSNPAARLASQSQKAERALPRMSHPDDLRAVFKAAARRTLGRSEIGDETINQMVAAYQQAQVSSQQPGAQIEPPDPEVFADRELKRRDPVAYDAHSALDAFDQIAQLMRGGSIGGD